MTVRACGGDECRTVQVDYSRPTGNTLAVLAFGDGVATGEAPPLAPYYRVDFDAGAAPWVAILYVPSERVYAAGAAWHPAGRKARTALDALIADLEPYPEPVPTRVSVNGFPVDDPENYAILFDAFPAAQFPGRDVPVAAIRVLGVPAPWYDEDAGLRYYPAVDTLDRGLEYVRPSQAAVSLVEGDLLVAASGSRSFSWPVVVALAALAGVAGLAGWRLYERRPRIPSEDPATRSPSRR